MKDRLQTQLFGPYFPSFSAHSYGYELSNDPKSVCKLLDFRFGPILEQPPLHSNMLHIFFALNCGFSAEISQ